MADIAGRSAGGGVRGRAGRATVLAVVMAAVLTVNLDTTIVNVALPSIGRQLHASTGGLQWVVDAYNLAFAGLVLVGGNIGDRYGRRATLVGGLALFSLASIAAASCTSVGDLVAARAAMGTGAALVFPTTLSIITTTFPERGARAKAIGAWGAVAGLGVAVGPVVGGALLDHLWWGSVFMALVPVGAVAAVAAVAVVPSSRAAHRPRLDPVGLALSVLGLGALVYSVIEAPGVGWLSWRSVAGFGAAAVILGAFVVAERRHLHPMLDVELFANARFSAASGSVAVAFFALFGFIFLITQYFQVVRSYTPLGTGVRILPVAGSIALASVLGTRAAVRFGNKAVVGSGLVLLASSFAWISTASADLGYPTIALQMVLMGTGLGLTTSPATESIMGVVRPEQAGAGSAVNDATRELGGTLGVAVIGSVYSSIYAGDVAGAARLVGGAPGAAVRAGVEGGETVSAHLAAVHSPLAAAVHDAVTAGFLSGLHAGCLSATGVCLAGAAGAFILLPSRPRPAASPAVTPSLVSPAAVPGA